VYKHRAIILNIACAAWVVWLGFPVLAQTSQQQPSAGNRPPDPAAIRQAPATTFKAPDDIDYRRVNIMSEGVRLHGELFSLKSLAGKKLPTVIQAHGWGGTAAGFRRDSIDLAKAGYLVLTFDYRGWGESDARLILAGSSPVNPVSGRSQKFTAEVVEVREVVDPLEFVTDWFNALHWAMGEPMVDAERIGLRGSSYSGGHIIYVAAHDPRVKAIVSQVSAVDSRPKAITTLGGSQEQQLKAAYEEATKRARGELGYPEPRQRGVYGNLIGAPIRDHLLRAGFVDDAAKVQCATLIIDAEKEELFDFKDHGKLAYDRIPGKDKKHVVIPGITHYGIYREAYNEAIKLAIEWFDKYLKK
jgi:dipeptidyl aminopeptidase/acylaminoacyl peptidase